MLTMREKFKRYIDAGFPIIYLNSAEAEKCDALIQETADNRGIIEWSAADGFWDMKDNVREPEQSILQTLNHINVDEEAFEEKIIVLKDIHPYLEDPQVIALLKKFALESLNGLGCNVVIVSPVCVIPKEIESYVTILELDPVSEAEIRQIILSFIDEQGITKPTNEFLNELVNSFKGLSDTENSKIF